MDDKLTTEQNHIIEALKRFKDEHSSDPAFVEALVDAIVYEVAKGSLLPLFQTHPDIIMKFIGTCLKKLEEAYSILDKSITTDLAQRVCLTLLRLVECLGERRHANMKLDVPISKEDLAVIVGSSREVISTVMATLEKNNILALYEHKIVIRDYDRLRAIASEVRIH
jgi:CRP/FNR family transcriptional regulator